VRLLLYCSAGRRAAWCVSIVCLRGYFEFTKVSGLLRALIVHTSMQRFMGTRLSDWSAPAAVRRSPTGHLSVLVHAAPPHPSRTLAQAYHAD